VRVALEREAARLAAQHRRPVAIAHVEEAVMRMEDAPTAQQMYEADVDFHRALFQASGNAGLIFLSEAVGDLIAQSVTERRGRMQKLSEDKEEMRVLHRNILEAVQSGDSEAAMHSIDNHFDRLDMLSQALT